MNLEDVTVNGEPGTGGCGAGAWAQLHLPVSKTDPQGRGAWRTLACACPSPVCPVAALMRVIRKVKSIHMKAKTRKAGHNCPLAARSDGSRSQKAEVVKFYTDLAVWDGQPRGHFTGHSARVTGAMRMALAGHSEWMIQVFGRWGSSAVLRYVREAILGVRGGRVAQITEGTGTSTLPDHQADLKTVIWDALNEGKGHNGQVSMKKVLMELVAQHIVRNWPSEAGNATDQQALGQKLESRVRQAAKHVQERTRVAELQKVVAANGKTHWSVSGSTSLCGARVPRQKRRGGEESGAWCVRCSKRKAKLDGRQLMWRSRSDREFDQMIDGPATR